LKVVNIGVENELTSERKKMVKRERQLAKDQRLNKSRKAIDERND
jgi:hypothetical protein